MMSQNTAEPVSAVQYHGRTSHVRHRITPHSLDFSRYPAPFKTYGYHDRISLNRGVRDPSGSGKEPDS